ncbi:MAG: type II and III secretion system protein family protein [Hyphomicrobium aestuarii]|nr:type II and III secretion system protein family protein [Hyphomicrobium aestuarii]
MAASCALLLMAAMAPPATADGGIDSSSMLRIATTVELPVSRKLTLGLNRGIIIELPTDVQDVVISSPGLVEATVLTARRISLAARTVGEGNVFFLGKDGRRLVTLDLVVNRDVKDLADTLRQHLPGSKLKLQGSGDGVIISGTVAKPEDASRAEQLAKMHLKGATIVNLIATHEKEQVLLKVTVAEVNRDAVRRLGVNLPEAIVKAGDVTFAKVIQNSFPVTAAVAPQAIFNPPFLGAPGGPFPPTVFSGTALQGSADLGNGKRITSIIEAFERVGLARTLAEPTLTAISGQTAKFHAGGEFPIPVSQENNTISVEWKPFGVQISFTPSVLSEGRIGLKIAAEVSELSSEGAVAIGSISIRAISLRKAETTVEMPSGSSLAIAGLLSDQVRQSVEGVPELRSLPILGALFRSKDYQDRKSELLIMVTPIIVRPTDPREFSKPGDGLAAPSDLKGQFYGSLNRIYGPTKQLAGGASTKDAGFIVEYPDYGGRK